MKSTERLLSRLQAVIDDCREEIASEKKKMYGTHYTNVAVSVHLLQDDGSFYYSNGKYGPQTPRMTVATFYRGACVDAEKRARDLRDELNAKEE